MLNILIPLGSHTNFSESEEYPYPKPLVEISGKPMIQKVIENLSKIKGEKRFIFILREDDCRRFHLDTTVRLLAGKDAIVIKLQSETKGAVCSALLAVDYICNTSTLIIANGDQLFEIDLNECLSLFRSNKADAGCLCIDSVHPRWSYVRLDGDSIVEAAEKRPISRHAITGFYYFSHGKIFVEAAKSSIRKDVNLNGIYYIAPVLNELVLKNYKLKAITISKSDYHAFYSTQKIEEYELWSAKNR
jgi:NDP-sugar pyrophosphorylase family protein